MIEFMSVRSSKVHCTMVQCSVGLYLSLFMGLFLINALSMCFDGILQISCLSSIWKTKLFVYGKLLRRTD